MLLGAVRIVIPPRELVIPRAIQKASSFFKNPMHFEGKAILSDSGQKLKQLASRTKLPPFPTDKYMRKYVHSIWVKGTAFKTDTWELLNLLYPKKAIDRFSPDQLHIMNEWIEHSRNYANHYFTEADILADWGFTYSEIVNASEDLVKKLEKMFFVEKSNLQHDHKEIQGGILKWLQGNERKPTVG
jgi:hypothetical protein